MGSALLARPKEHSGEASGKGENQGVTNPLSSLFQQVQAESRVPFEWIGMDIVGPLPKSGWGHEYILVMVDYTTRYPEAVPLRKATSKAIAQELFLLCSRVGIPKDIITDQGTPFVSRTDGLVERFNQTLKCMLGKVVAQDRRDWDLLIPYILFAVRQVPQASTGFSPFELLDSRRPRGLLNVVREVWEQQPSPYCSVIEYVREMQQRIDTMAPIVHEHMEEAQRAQQRAYNPPAQPREFQPGDHVLVLVPTTTCKFLATWQGHYTVREKVGPVNYRLDQPGRRKSQQVYHINLLNRGLSRPPGSLASPQAKPRPERRFSGAKNSFPPNVRNLPSWWSTSGMCSPPPLAGPRSSSMTYGLP
ncbi:hypothetical protein SRHO_G00168070 [Serrasalmus rhombeus]